MSDAPKPFPAAEAAPHPRSEVPTSEYAREIGPDPEADLHGDPDDPSPAPSATEAAAVADWRVAHSLLTLRAQVNGLAPHRSIVSDGTIGDAAHQSRASDHNPWVRDGATGVVTAMDITNDPDNGCAGETLATAIRGARDGRVKYVIWNRRIANSATVGGAAAWEWRPYTGSNPHQHHVHISIKPERASYDSEAAWVLPGALGPTPVA